MYEGIMVDMICEMDPSYHDKIILSKDRKKSSYKVNSSRQCMKYYLEQSYFTNKLSKYLTDYGFVQNKYDMSIFNKMVNGEQITVQFHVDDLKVSHKDQAVLEDFLGDLRSEFGQKK